MLVTLVTILIWVLADAKSLVRLDRPLEIVFTAGPDSGRTIRVLPGQGWQGQVSVQFEGPNAAVARIDPILRRAVELSPGLVPAVPIEPGEHTVDLREALRSLQGFKSSGMTIKEVDPATVRVEVDSIVQVEARVRVVVPKGELDGSPTPRPERATISLPSRLAGTLDADPELTASITAEQLKDLPEARPGVVRGVGLILPASLRGRPSVRVDPPRVDVDLTLRSKTATYVVAAVPVQVQLSPEQADRYRVQLTSDSFISNVSVIGPRELIDRVRSGRERIIAVLRLEPDELDGGITSKEVVFVADPPLPASLTYQAQTTRVGLRIEPRQPPQDSGGPGSTPSGPSDAGEAGAGG